MENLKKKLVLADRITEKYPMDNLLSHHLPLLSKLEAARRMKLVEVTCPMPGETIADIGCETGHIESLLFRRCRSIYRFHCVDLSPKALSYARLRAKADGWYSRSDFIVSDAQNIMLDDDTVDVSISSHVLEHMENPVRGFKELVRITRPGGRILLNLPNEALLRASKRALLIFAPRWCTGQLKVVTPGHLQIVTKNFLRDIAQPYADIEKMFMWPTPILGLNIFALLRPKK